MSAHVPIPGQLVELSGRVDVTTVAAVRDALHTAVDAGSGDLVVDMTAVDVLDAAGLGVLVGTHRRALLGGRRLVLRAVPARTARLLQRTRLHRVLCVTSAPVAIT